MKSVDLTVSLENLSFFLARAEHEDVGRASHTSTHVAASRWSTWARSRRRDARRSRAGRSACRARRSRWCAAARVKKGDPLQAARLAGIMAAKQTSALIPLCHPLPLASVRVDLTEAKSGYDIEAHVSTTAQTGVEMEALTAVAVAALTVYDMVKAVDKGMVIGNIRLMLKTRRGERHIPEGGPGGRGQVGHVGQVGWGGCGRVRLAGKT